MVLSVRDIDNVLGVAKAKAIDVPVEVREISDRSITLRYKNYAIFIRKGGRAYRVSIWVERDDKVDVEFSDNIQDPFHIDNLDLDQDLKDVLKFYISNWDFLLEQKMAEIILKGNIKVIPKQPNDKEVLAYEIGRKLIEDLKIAMLKMNIGSKIESLGLYCYDGVIWFQCEEKVRSVIGKYLEASQNIRATRNVTEEIIKNKIEMLNTKIVSVEEDKPRVAFKNSVFDWDVFIESGDVGKSLTNPSQDIYVFHKIPHELNVDILKDVRKGLEIYIPPKDYKDVVAILKALAPRVYEMLKSWVWYRDVSDELLESRVSFLLEIIGRAMLPGYRLRNTIAFKDIFIILGPPNSGKSTFLVGLLGGVIGEENYKTTRLRYLGSDDEETLWRTLGRLYNALAVIMPDIGKRDKAGDWSIIRSIAGGDPIPARRLRENPFEYFPHYKFYIASNDPPQINEEGEAKQALLRRFKVIEFKNVFENNPDFKVALNDDEVNILIFCALHALRLAYLRGCKYSNTGVIDVEDVLNRYTYPEYKAIMDLVDRGILKLDPTLKTSSKELYNMVIDYISKKEGLEEEEGIVENVPNQTQFTLNLKKLLAKYGVKTVSLSNVTYFKGIGVPPKGLL